MDLSRPGVTALELAWPGVNARELAWPGVNARHGFVKEFMLGSGKLSLERP